MSYADTMSETDEMRAWEEGRLQGLKDAIQTMGNSRLLRNQIRDVKILVDNQTQFLKEVYWDDEAYGDDDK